MLQVFKMTLPGCVVHENVVEEDKGKPLDDKAENGLHECLKGGRSVREAKGHYEKFIMPFMRSKPTFFNIRGMYAYLVVTRAKIELGENLSVGKFI